MSPIAHTSKIFCGNLLNFPNKPCASRLGWPHFLCRIQLDVTPLFGPPVVIVCALRKLAGSEHRALEQLTAWPTAGKISSAPPSNLFLFLFQLDLKFLAFGNQLFLQLLSLLDIAGRPALVISSFNAISRSAIFAAYFESSSASSFFCASGLIFFDGTFFFKRSIASS